jgi:DNA-binding transcriptional MerR regulator
VSRTEDALTIDELARRVSMTARNVRAYQSRGLIPPPTLRGRTGYYGPQHVARLELIRELQAEGFNLEAIRRLLERTRGQSIGELLDFTRALAEPFGDEAPEVMSAEALGALGRPAHPGNRPPGGGPAARASARRRPVGAA